MIKHLAPPLFSAKFMAICISLAILPMLAIPYANAQRAFVNTSFEDNDPSGPGVANFQIFNDDDVPGWEDQTGQIELWDSGFLSTPSYDGNVHAEMNASSPGTFYQDICMESGETFSWSFAHGARAGGADPQIAVFEVVEPATGTLVQSLATQSTAIGAGWSLNTGTATYSGAAGTKRFQFRSTNPGSYGNFLDAIVVSLAAYVEMDANSNSAEASSSGPGMVVSGTTTVSVDIPFTITGGTATLTDDYTVDAAFVTIPPGVYADVAFALPITIVDDSVLEPDETIIFEIGTPSSTQIKVASGNCGPLPKTSATHTIEDNDPNLSIAKSVETYDEDLSDGIAAYALPGNDVIYTITIVNSGNGPTDTDSVVLIDALPSQIEFYNGDIDDAGPQTDPVVFTQSGAGLGFFYASNIGYASGAIAPTSFSNCNYTPLAGYDPAVRYICLNPDGAFGSGDPAPTASIQFRARIK